MMVDRLSSELVVAQVEEDSAFMQKASYWWTCPSAKGKEDGS
jgi:hypothetical protein